MSKDTPDPIQEYKFSMHSEEPRDTPDFYGKGLIEDIQKRSLEATPKPIESLDELDEIILAPARWQLDDYIQAKQALKTYILNEIIGENMEHDLYCQYKVSECLCGAEQVNKTKAHQRAKLGVTNE